MMELAGSAIRFTHPLFSSVVHSSASTAGRRRVHRQLAQVTSDPEERARHLALSAFGPDEQLGAGLEEAARVSPGRGAPDAAAELGELSARLTPSSHGESLARRSLT